MLANDPICHTRPVVYLWVLDRWHYSQVFLSFWHIGTFLITTIFYASYCTHLGALAPLNEVKYCLASANAN